LIGRNGAGKSTTLKLISRIMEPTAGRIEVMGRVGALLELGAGFHPELSGHDNIFLAGSLLGMSREEVQRKYDAIVAFSELESFIRMPVKHYSSGMFARLAFSVNVHLNPEVLLVDEVLAVGDQAFQLKCLDRIGALKQQGVTICFVSHSVEMVRLTCKRVLWFDDGRLVEDGLAEPVIRRYIETSINREAERLSRAHASLPDQSEFRWGDRQVEIVHVRVTDERGREQAVFATGQPLAIHVEYRAHRPTESPIFGLAIYRHDGLQICGPNTAFDDFVLPTVEGSGSVTYRIPALPLLEGLYWISVAVADKAYTKSYDYHDRLYAFRVINQGLRVKERYGLVTLYGQWQHVTDRETSQAI
jgi:lipopolysaccharide transport system ATP-binding protein